MDIEPYKKFVEPFLTSELPKEEGLYLYVKIFHNPYKIEVDLVEVREIKGFLEADSDSWYTWNGINNVDDLYECDEKYWSKKLNFKNDG